MNRAVVIVILILVLMTTSTKCETNIENDYISDAYDYFLSSNDSEKASIAIESIEHQLEMNPLDFWALCSLCKITFDQRIYEQRVDINDMVAYLNNAIQCNEDPPYFYIPYAIFASQLLRIGYFDEDDALRKEALDYIKMVFPVFAQNVDFSASTFENMGYQEKLLLIEYIDIMICVIEYPQKTSAWREDIEGFSVKDREIALQSLIEVCYEPDGTYRFPALLKSVYGEMCFIYQIITMTEQKRIEMKHEKADQGKLDYSIEMFSKYMQSYDSIKKEDINSVGDKMLSGDAWVNALSMTDEYMEQKIRPYYMQILMMND